MITTNNTGLNEVAAVRVRNASGGWSHILLLNARGRLLGRFRLRDFRPQTVQRWAERIRRQHGIAA